MKSLSSYLGVIDLQMIVLEQNVCSLFYAWIFFSVADAHRGGPQVQDVHVQQRQNASTFTPFVNSISIPAAQIVGRQIMQQPNMSGYASPIGNTNPVIR
jgi:hypothetical protein